MKRIILPLLLAGVLLLAGCASAFQKEYSYAAPFSYNIRRSGGDATEISNYNMLKSALIDLINSHEESGAFRFSRYNGSVADDVAAACLEIRTTNPLGAYAVETLTCDTSRIVSYYTADIQVTYKKTAGEIRDIVGVSGLPELRERLLDAVTGYEAQTVLRVYSAQVDEDSIASLVEDFHFSDPVTVVTEPEAEIASYPGEGINRIYDVRLRYAAAPARLREMSAQLSGRVRELAGEITAETQPRLALECANRLFALLTAEGGTYGGTAYGALVEGYADSKGVALAYKALCDALGIECVVVRGNIGSMEAEEHYWNIIGLEGAYYHVDVSAFRWGRAGAFLLDDASLWGIYLWDAEAYPACTGALRYSDVAPEERLTGLETGTGAEEPIQPPEGTEFPGGTEEPSPADRPGEPEPTEDPPPPEETAGPDETEEPEKNGGPDEILS